MSKKEVEEKNGVQKEKRNYSVLLKQKDFCKLLIAYFISRLGDSLDIVAYSWIMYEITGSEALLAVIMGLNYIPTIFLMPFTGALVDNFNKKKVMIITDIIRFIIVSLIVVFYISGSLNSALLIIFTLLTSTVEAFRIPAANALLPSLIKKDTFSIGQGANFTLSQIATFIGFSLAGLSIAVIGSGGTLILDAMTFLCSAILIFTIRHKEIFQKKATDLRIVITNFKEGTKFFSANKTIKTLALVGVLFNLSTMALSVFQTPYVQDYLNLGAEMLSYIKTLSALSIGFGAAFAPKIKKTPYSKILAVFGSLFGCSLMIAAFAPYISINWIQYSIVSFAMIGMGIASGVISVVMGTCKMKAIPLDMMGRITGIYGAIMQTALPVSSFICSFLVLYLPLTYVWAIFGLITLSTFILLFISERLNNLD